MDSIPDPLDPPPAHFTGATIGPAHAATPVARFGLLAYLALLATGFTLYVARDVFIPLCLAVLLKMLLAPLMRLIMRLHIPQALAAVMVTAMLLAGAGGVFYAVEIPAERWVQQLPRDLPKVNAKLRNILDPLHRVQQATRQMEQVAQPDQQEKSVVVRQPGLSEALFSSTRAFLISIATVLLLLFALLASGDHFLRRVVEGLPRFAEKRHAVEVVRLVEHDISRYLTTITLINITMGCIAGTIAWFAGLPDPLVWGVLAGLANYIPYLGPLTTTGVLAFVGLMTYSDVGQGFIPAACYAGATLIEGNFLTPLVLSHRLQINAVCVFVGLMVFEFLWGIPGMLLAVPILAMVRIVCDHVEPLVPIGRLLGEGKPSELAGHPMPQNGDGAAK